MSALALTGADLVRALAGVAARPAVANAVRAKAEELAAAIEATATQTGHPVEVRLIPISSGTIDVAVSAPGLFAREFGARDGSADPVVAPAIAHIAGRV